jgi:glycosyltransferase involved in cell wall biosynthesis
MLRGKDIIFISSIDWDFLWQHPQEISHRLVESGNRVLFIENTGVRTPTLNDAKRILHRLKLWSRSLGSGGVRQVAPNLYVCSPLVLPPFGPRWHRLINRKILLPLVRRTAAYLGMEEPLLWTHLPTNTALEMIKLLRAPRSLAVYYCIADFSQLTPYAAQLMQSERDIILTSDMVFVNSTQLAEHCRRWRPDVNIFPPGVNLEAFPVTETSGAREISYTNNGSRDSGGQSSTFKTVIGYVGGLHRFVDLELITKMASERPDWTWVFIGPVQTPVGELSNLPNVHFLGQRPHSELVNYISSFDVCIVPYLDNQETSTIVPVKINEYLAVGKPVVSTELPAVLDFNAKYGILKTSPPSVSSFLQAIEDSLNESNGVDVITRRREVAALSDWHGRLNEMSALIEEKLQEKLNAQTR